MFGGLCRKEKISHINYDIPSHVTEEKCFFFKTRKLLLKKEFMESPDN